MLFWFCLSSLCYNNYLDMPKILVDYRRWNRLIKLELSSQCSQLVIDITSTLQSYFFNMTRFGNEEIIILSWCHIFNNLTGWLS